MPRREEKSEAEFARAQKVLVGGVNSPVRAFAAVGGTPPIIAKACGSHITDVDGNTYIDYVCGYGPAILGHAPQQVVTAISKAARNGTSFGAPTRLETRLAEAVVQAVPSVEKVRFVSSGTEAVMSAIRLARGVTARSKIIKCVGCYHGHADALLVSAGSGAMTLGVPSSPGVPHGATADTILVPYNDLAAAGEAMKKFGGQIAAMLVEPVAANMGLVAPVEGYLTGLRQLCDEHGVLLIFDEVITGFRLGLGGAQEFFGVLPDITTLGKVLGGGLPVGAYGGPAEIMKHLAPEGPVYQAGTLSGNPVAMAAGLATLEAIQEDGFHKSLNSMTERLGRALGEARDEAGLHGKVHVRGVGSMLCCFFAPGPVRNYDDVAACNTDAYAALFHAMLAAGVYLAPSQYETMFVSAAHTDGDIEQTTAAARTAFRRAAEVM